MKKSSQEKSVLCTSLKSVIYGGKTNLSNADVNYIYKEWARFLKDKTNLTQLKEMLVDKSKKHEDTIERELNSLPLETQCKLLLDEYVREKRNNQ